MVVLEAEAHFNDVALSFSQKIERLIQQFLVDRILKIATDDIGISPKDIGEQQFVSVPVHIQRLIEADLELQSSGFAKMHQYLIFDAAGRVCGKLDLFIGIERFDGFHESDRPNADQVLGCNAGIVELSRQIDDEAQIMYDQPVLCPLLGARRFDAACFLLGVERRRKRLAGMHIKDRVFSSDPQQQANPNP